MTPNNPKLSIVIPTYNEEAHIALTLRSIFEHSTTQNIHEILVIDGGSTDQTVRIARNLGATVITAAKGRAKQLNYGAKKSKGEILYFLHADTIPPKNFDTCIINVVKEGRAAGCFQMQFDSDSRFLRFFAWLTRVNHSLFRGGDQSLFITNALFESVGGFNEDYIVFEDNEFIRRLYQRTSFKVLPQQVKTSARRYDKNGSIKLQYHFGIIHLKNFFGAGPEKLNDYYKRKITS